MFNATPHKTFVTATALMLDLLANDVIAETPDHRLSKRQLEWFVDHCDTRIRFNYATDDHWRKWLENRDRRIDPRSQCKVWIRHWFKAFCLHPEQYVGRWQEAIAD